MNNNTDEFDFDENIFFNPTPTPTTQIPQPAQPIQSNPPTQPDQPTQPIQPMQPMQPIQSTQPNPQTSTTTTQIPQPAQPAQFTPTYTQPNTTPTLPNPNKHKKTRKTLTTTLLILAIPLTFITGYTTGKTLAPNNTPIKTIAKIDSKDTILSQIDTMRDNQIKLLQKNIAKLKPENDNIKIEDKISIVDKNNTITKNLDEFFNKLLDPTPPRPQDITQYFTNPTNPTIKNIINGESTQKILKKPGTKTGGIHLLLDNISNENQTTYTALVPYAYEQHLLTNIYNLATDENGKIISIYYVGFFDNQKNNTYFDTLNKTRTFKP